MHKNLDWMEAILSGRDGFIRLKTKLVRFLLHGGGFAKNNTSKTNIGDS